MENILPIIILIFFLQLNISNSATYSVGSEKKYNRIIDVVKQVLPGDTILLFGTFNQGEYIENLHGKVGQMIVIQSGESNNALYDCSGTAIQFSNVSYLKIKNLSFKNQTNNGLNIDDQGVFSKPSNHIEIENCIWLGMNAVGNNDCLKMSGIDDFIVKNCVFNNGSPGGSFIDMVGCHNGIVENSKFFKGGSNSIQMKGGTARIIVRRNEFINGGQRALNIGGSTGMEFFRPQNASSEAEQINVHSNIFWGSIAAFAFVGSRNCSFNHNTVVNPEKWCFRILQENMNNQLVKCSYNSVTNNIFYFGANVSTIINIGANTQPETFAYDKNLWYNYDNINWQMPKYEGTFTDQLYGLNPLFVNILDSNLALKENSPAIGAASLGIVSDSLDYQGNKFSFPYSIVSINFKFTNINDCNKEIKDLFMYPIPANESINISSKYLAIKSIYIYDLKGNIFETIDATLRKELTINLNKYPKGKYFLQILYADYSTAIYSIIVE